MANKFWPATSLTGGGDGALDSIDDDDLTDGDICFVIDRTNKKFIPYFYDSSSELAESSPDIIAPDTGTGRWIMLQLIHSQPSSGDYKIRSFRREANGDLTYVYKETAES